MTLSEHNKFTQAAMIAVLVNNDFHYMHFMSIGEDFDKSHDLAAYYYKKIEDEVDYLMELALEVGVAIYNFSNAKKIVPEYPVEDKEYYDYQTLIKCLTDKIQIYVSSLRNLRESTDNSSIQSRLDDMIRDWEKEMYYRLARRTEIVPANPFINTGLDARVSSLINSTRREI